MNHPVYLDPNGNDGYEWYIPITYTLVDGTTTNFSETHTMQYLEPGQNSMTIDIGFNPAPIIFNIQSTGFYRVNYDTSNWQKIVDFMTNGDFEVRQSISFKFCFIEDF